MGIPGTPFLPKVPEKQVTHRGGCGPSARLGLWGVPPPPLGRASEPEMGWFKARPAPLGLPGSPSLISGEVGELIPQVGGGAPACRGSGSLLASVAPTSPPTRLPPHQPAHRPTHRLPGLGPRSWGRNVCCGVCTRGLPRLGRGLLVQSRTPPARVHRPQRSVSVVPVACGLTW